MTSGDTSGLAVSVVMATYNGERFLEQALQSVANQTLAPAEIIVVDDGSTDRSVEVARASGARVVTLSHSGVCVARNTGILAATSPLVAMMDQDDEWHPEKLDDQVAALARFPDAVMVATDAELIDEHGAVLDPSFLDNPDRAYARLRPAQTSEVIDYFPDIADQIHLTGWFLLPSAVLVRRSTLIETGMFDERIVLSEDVACFLRLFLRGGLVMLRRPRTRWRIHETNTHKNVLRMLRGSLCLSRDAAARPGTYPAAYQRRLAQELPSLLRGLGRQELEMGDFAAGRRLLMEASRSAPDLRSVVMLAASALGQHGLRSALRLFRAVKPIRVRKS